MRKMSVVLCGLSIVFALMVGPAGPATAAATGPAAVTKVTAKTDKRAFTSIQNVTTGKKVKAVGYRTCLKLSAHKKWAGLYAVTVYRGSAHKSRKYVGTLVLEKGWDQDPCFGAGKTRTEAKKMRKAGMYGLEPKTTYTFEVHAAGGRSHKDTLKTVKVKTR